MTTNIRLISLAETLERLGAGRGGRYGGKSKLFDDKKKGLWPPSIKRGRSSLELEHEVNAMLAAIAAGATEDERRELVRSLIEKRRTIALMVGVPATTEAE